MFTNARQIAQASNRSVESILLDGLTLLFRVMPDAANGHVFEVLHLYLNDHISLARASELLGLSSYRT